MVQCYPEPSGGFRVQGVGGRDELVLGGLSSFLTYALRAMGLLQRDYYDIVDVDQFGSEGLFNGAALDAVKHG